MRGITPHETLVARWWVVRPLVLQVARSSVASCVGEEVQDEVLRRVPSGARLSVAFAVGKATKLFTVQHMINA